MTFTAEEKYREAMREVEMRERVYGKKGQLTPTDQKRIAIMREIAEEFRLMTEKQRLI